MCDEKVWDETLMEDGVMPSTTRSRKQQVFWVVEDDVKFIFCDYCYFPTLFVVCKLCPTFSFIFDSYHKLLCLCWTQVSWRGLFSANVLMNYKKEAR
jgi:hypothetical protein